MSRSQSTDAATQQPRGKTTIREMVERLRALPRPPSIEKRDREEEGAGETACSARDTDHT